MDGTDAFYYFATCCFRAPSLWGREDALTHNYAYAWTPSRTIALMRGPPCLYCIRDAGRDGRRRAAQQPEIWVSVQVR
jgi:hypothetical protein